jgi:hypothetical protein
MTLGSRGALPRFSAPRRVLDAATGSWNHAIKSASGAAILLPVLFCLSAPAHAGAPYVTDDPDPPEPGMWEIDAFVEGAHCHGLVEGAAGLDINYGLAEDLQLAVAVATAFEHAERTESGVADAEIGIKYRFLHQQEGSWIPDVAVYPSLGLPTGAQRFSSGEVTAFLPLWAQKDFGDWSVFGGGGYVLNPSDAGTRQVTTRMNLGAEIYHRTPDEVGGRSLTGAGIGMVLDLNDRWALRASIGQLLTNHQLDADAYTFYLGLTLAH